MKVSQIVAVLTVAVLVLGVGLLVKNISWREITVPRPPRGEAATNPLYAAQHLVQELGGHTERRRSLGVLPPADAVIVLSDWNWSVIERRRRELERWVEAGGRLLIDNSLIGGEQQLQEWSGLALHSPEQEPEEAAAEESEAETPEPKSDTEEIIERAIDQRLPLFAGDCSELSAALPRLGNRNVYMVCKHEMGTWLTSDHTPDWALVDEQQIQVARVGIGRGSVTMLAARPFDNRLLFVADHGLLFTAAAQLRRGDMVYFISEGRGTPLLTLLWKYGAPVVVLSLVMVVLWLWRGALRFGPAARVSETAQRSLAEQIRGTGRFVVRIGAGRALHAAASRALHEAATKHIVRYSSLPGPARTDAIARITQIDATSLAHAFDASRQRGAGELRTAVSLLETARRKLMRDR